MNLTRKLSVVGALLAVSAGVFVACGSSDSGSGGSGGNGAAASGGAGGSGAGGGGGILNTDSGTGGFFGDAGPSGDAISEGFDPDGACATTTESATLARANILFLIDTTGSMNCNAPPYQTSAQCSGTKLDPSKLSKWEITRDALVLAIQGLEDTDPLPSVGIMYLKSDAQCKNPTEPSVEVQPLSGDAANDSQLNKLQFSLAGVTPSGDTPIVASTMAAYAYMNANAADFDGNRFVVLLTDGAETCNQAGKPWLIGKVGEVSSQLNIRTFVLGAPGSEDERAFLSQIAYAGGTPSSPTCDHSGAPANAGDCHMDMTLPNMTFADELAKNLKAISGVALSCEFDVPVPGPNDPPVNPNKVNVKYGHGDGTSEYILQDTTIPCDDPANAGWTYADNNTKIILCGAACDAVKKDPQASISIELGCQTQQVPPK